MQYLITLYVMVADFLATKCVQIHAIARNDGKEDHKTISPKQLHG